VKQSKRSSYIHVGYIASEDDILSSRTENVTGSATSRLFAKHDANTLMMMMMMMMMHFISQHDAMHCTVRAVRPPICLSQSGIVKCQAVYIASERS